MCYGGYREQLVSHNTHFKTDVKDKPCHGLNASYVDARTGALILKNGINRKLKK